ncbi:putative penicillin-binding protein [Actinoplanes missouriensis 431]|uniref:Putative penicillin-binding protein n=1 Tax=Actinoplanes missouriensis (strain ATCC 14538 / DSM 43046 / CBS 188.64 / JCM 3121 / NBRC 102363 / NCIMB 12654 / NRRL B-3342 / UNCC 431) TaxID=512565 RepID=I0HH94_ACTM4|nr:penicillin-binding transpeptidase domain-containing protein [Actinoplanes missouriensis]BAL92381.1 putative penicillin-binding protein [Actinoplanes missouriensis 431]
MRRTTAGIAALLVLAAGGLAGCSADPPEDAVSAFVAGWQSGDLNDVGFVTASGSGIAAPEVLTGIRELYGDLTGPPPAVSAGKTTTTGDDASTPITVKWTLPGGVEWSYQSTVRATKAGRDDWAVIWEPALVQPDLATGDKLRLRRVASDRATIQDADGKPLVGPQKVVVIGVSPEKITDFTKLKNGLAAAFKKVAVDVDLDALKGRVDAADPGAFIDLVTLRRADYNKVRNQVRPLPGTVFREETRQLAPTRAFARALLGTVDAATKEDIDARPDVLKVGDQAGHGGLQQKYDDTLRGTAGLSVVISREAADGAVEDDPIFQSDPVDGKPVKVTIDTATQNAADKALAGEKQPSSMVAIRVSDGAVLAVANGPDAGGVNTALTGQVPPGSTFKMVSGYGVLARDVVTADTVVDCPKTFTVDGREFKNSHDEALGKVPFHVDFAKSCNTAFASLAPKLTAAGLQEASTALGLGGAWDMGIEAYTGEVSDGGTGTELAAAIFGQGSTVVSPVAMAAATAAVAKGQFQPPKLVLDPAPAKPGEAGPQLDPEAVASLREMMREVVTNGTGTALKSVPGKPVHGKTGTAEFENGSEDTHSWFVGYQDDVAFAVMVQKGGAGSEAAVPIVKRFLTELNK